jgi:hypothetical protein
MGVVEGLVVTVNDINTVNVTFGYGYAPNGEKVTLLVGRNVAPGPSSDIINYYYICLTYTEQFTNPEPHEDQSKTYYTAVNEDVLGSRLSAKTVAAYDALSGSNSDLTLDAKDRTLILAVCKRESSTIKIYSPPQFNALLKSVTQPSNMTGIVVNSISPNTPCGTGTLKLTYTDNKPYASWKAYGDSFGASVELQIDKESKDIPSSGGTFINITPMFKDLPDTDTSSDINIQYLYEAEQSSYLPHAYNAQLKAFTAVDEHHRNLIGSGQPSINNPHGLSWKDIADFDANVIAQDNNVVFNSTGIAKNSLPPTSRDDLKITFITNDGVSPSTFTVTDFTATTNTNITDLNLAVINGIQVNKLTNATAQTFYETATDTYGLYGVYVTDIGTIVKKLRCDFSYANNVKLVDISDNWQPAVNETIAFSFIKSGTAATIQVGNGPVVAVNYSTDNVMTVYADANRWVKFYIDSMAISGLPNTTSSGFNIVVYPVAPSSKFLLSGYVHFTGGSATGKLGYGNPATYVDKRTFGTLTADKLADSAINALSATPFSEYFVNHIVRGFDYAQSALNFTLYPGLAYVAGNRYEVLSSSTLTVPPSTTSYIYLVSLTPYTYSFVATQTIVNDPTYLQLYTVSSTDISITVLGKTAKVITGVGGDYSLTVDVNGNGNFTTIKDALRFITNDRTARSISTSQKYTITLKQGTYAISDGTVIDSSVAFIGESASIQMGTGISIAINITSNGVSFKNVTFTSGTTALTNYISTAYDTSFVDCTFYWCQVQIVRTGVLYVLPLNIVGCSFNHSVVNTNLTTTGTLNIDRCSFDASYITGNLLSVNIANCLISNISKFILADISTYTTSNLRMYACTFTNSSALFIKRSMISSSNIAISACSFNGTHGSDPLFAINNCSAINISNNTFIGTNAILDLSLSDTFETSVFDISGLTFSKNTVSEVIGNIISNSGSITVLRLSNLSVCSNEITFGNTASKFIDLTCDKLTSVNVSNNSLMSAATASYLISLATHKVSSDYGINSVSISNNTVSFVANSNNQSGGFAITSDIDSVVWPVQIRTVNINGNTLNDCRPISSLISIAGSNCNVSSNTISIASDANSSTTSCIDFNAVVNGAASNNNIVSYASCNINGIFLHDAAINPQNFTTTNCSAVGNNISSVGGSAIRVLSGGTITSIKIDSNNCEDCGANIVASTGNGIISVFGKLSMIDVSNNNVHITKRITGSANSTSIGFIYINGSATSMADGTLNISNNAISNADLNSLTAFGNNDLKWNGIKLVDIGSAGVTSNSARIANNMVSLQNKDNDDVSPNNVHGIYLSTGANGFNIVNNIVSSINIPLYVTTTDGSQVYNATISGNVINSYSSHVQAVAIDTNSQARFVGLEFTKNKITRTLTVNDKPLVDINTTVVTGIFTNNVFYIKTDSNAYTSSILKFYHIDAGCVVDNVFTRPHGFPGVDYKPNDNTVVDSITNFISTSGFASSAGDSTANPILKIMHPGTHCTSSLLSNFGVALDRVQTNNQQNAKIASGNQGLNVNDYDHKAALYANATVVRAQGGSADTSIYLGTLSYGGAGVYPDAFTQSLFLFRNVITDNIAG